MLLDVGKLRKREHIHRVERPEGLSPAPADDAARAHLGAAAEDESAEYEFGGATVIDLDVTKDGVRVRLQGWLDSMLRLECGRCLERFDFPVHRDLDLFYLPQSHNRGQGEREIEDEDLSIGYYRDEVIDLGQVIREQFYLALPMKPLCRPDCRGLCPVCGTNLNQAPCACRRDWVDPRLDALKGLFKK